MEPKPEKVDFGGAETVTSGVTRILPGTYFEEEQGAELRSRENELAAERSKVAYRDAEIERWRADYADTVTCLNNERKRFVELLEERDTKIAQLHAAGYRQAETIARLGALPGADVMERAGAIVRAYIGRGVRFVVGPHVHAEDMAKDIASALQQYGDERAAAAIEEAVQLALMYRDEADTGKHPDIGDPDHSAGQGYAANVIANRIRALAAKPGSET